MQARNSHSSSTAIAALFAIARHGAAAAVSSVSAVSPSPAAACPTCRGPTHSWDTIPVSLHTCRRDTNGRGEFGPSDLDVISRFPLVTIEKWQGDRAVDVDDRPSSTGGRPVFLWEDEAWTNAARGVKAVNPNVSVIVWMDTMLVYTGWNVDPSNSTVNVTLNPDASRKCATGHFRPAEYLERSDKDGGRRLLLRNRTGGLATEDWSGCHVYDHRMADARKYWRDMCLGMTSSGFVDGCGADFSAMGANRWSAHTDPSYVARELGLTLDVAADWADGHRLMMVETQAALGDGLLVGKDGAELGDHVNGVLQEGACSGTNKTVNTLRALSERAKAAGPAGRSWVFQCHGNDASVHTLAAFLSGAGQGHYFSFGAWNDGVAGHWSDDFSRPLGAPLGDATYNGSSWLREFASGTKVTFTPHVDSKGKDAGGTGVIVWSEQLLTETSLVQSTA